MEILRWWSEAFGVIAGLSGLYAAWGRGDWLLAFISVGLLVAIYSIIRLTKERDNLRESSESS